VIPLTEFDPDTSAVLEPSAVQYLPQLPERAVLCFFPEAMADWAERGWLERIGEFGPDVGGQPVYLTTASAPLPEGAGPQEPVVVFHPGVGAPLAAHHLEQAIASGVRSVIACGGAGSLVASGMGDVAVPTSALRDEGTSFHYAPPSRTLDADAGVVATITEVLGEQGVAWTTGRTWTTDAIYRETPTRIASRVDEGCVTVEMENAALTAVASFRGVRFGQILLMADDLAGEAWEERGWMSAWDARARFLDLALRIVRRLG
jgi:uridine phosphorylase